MSSSLLLNWPSGSLDSMERKWTVICSLPSVTVSYIFSGCVECRFCVKYLRSKSLRLSSKSSTTREVRLRLLPLRVELSKFLGYDNISIFSRACQKMGIPAQECLSPIMFDNSQVIKARVSHCVAKGGHQQSSPFRSVRLQIRSEAAEGADGFSSGVLYLSQVRMICSHQDGAEGGGDGDGRGGEA